MLELLKSIGFFKHFGISRGGRAHVAHMVFWLQGIRAWTHDWVIALQGFPVIAVSTSFLVHLWSSGYDVSLTR